MNSFQRFFGHLNTVMTHRRWVRHFCFMCSLYKQGLLHDLSKYSPTEFTESVKYYQGDRSPIDACKEANGYSMAWFHHRGRNKHHYEFWVDNFDKGTIPVKMPWKYALEQVCDYIGAGVAYSKGIKNFSMQSEMEWWQKKREIAKMHEDTKWLVDTLFQKFLKDGIEHTLKDKEYLNNLRKTYEKDD